MLAELRVLIVEDNHELRTATLEALHDQGIHCVGIDSAEAVPAALMREHFDLVVLDLNLPGEDGLSVARRIRAERPAMGIIMTTARTLPQERREGYDSGADMYLAKPVSLDELSGAISALVRRLPSPDTATDIVLDKRRLLLVDKQQREVALTPTEARLLEAWCSAPDQQLPTQVLLSLMRRAPADDPKRALEITITRLRKKLLQVGCGEPGIKAVRGWGYQLAEKIRCR